jgi:DHA1 family tetracycline resistance protein-like MFS transporter
MGLSQPNTIAIVSSLADRKSQGEILGINQSVQSLAIGTPPLFAGILAAYSIYLPIVGASVFVLAAWVVFVFWCILFLYIGPLGSRLCLLFLYWVLLLFS